MAVCVLSLFCLNIDDRNQIQSTKFSGNYLQEYVCVRKLVKNNSHNLDDVLSGVKEVNQGKKVNLSFEFTNTGMTNSIHIVNISIVYKYKRFKRPIFCSCTVKVVSEYVSLLHILHTCTI